MNQKALVEGFEKLVFATLLLHPTKFVSQIMLIAIKETFLLDEIAKHQAIEHNRCIPLLALIVFGGNLIVNTCNEPSKRLMFLRKP